MNSLDANIRNNKTKGELNSLRNNGNVPAIIYVGAMPAEGLYLLVARVATAYYFIHFLIILPVLGYKERTIPLPLSIMKPVLGGSLNLEGVKKKETLN